MAREERRRGSPPLRIGVDTEWADALEEDEAAEEEESATAAERRRPSRRPPRLAVVQLAVHGRGAWVIDALGHPARRAVGELLRWALNGDPADDDAVAVLGFAFQGDLSVLRPICGGDLCCARARRPAAVGAPRPGGLAAVAAEGVRAHARQGARQSGAVQRLGAPSAAARADSVRRARCRGAARHPRRAAQAGRGAAGRWVGRSDDRSTAHREFARRLPLRASWSRTARSARCSAPSSRPRTCFCRRCLSKRWGGGRGESPKVPPRREDDYPTFTYPLSSSFLATTSSLGASL